MKFVAGIVEGRGGKDVQRLDENLPISARFLNVERLILNDVCGINLLA